MWPRSVLRIIILGVFTEVSGLPASIINIGGIFSNSLEEQVFRLAVDYVNRDEIIGHGITLDYVTNITSPLEEFQNIQLACNYAERGVMAIIGPMSSTSVKAVAPVSAALHIPQISPAATNPRLGDKATWPYLVRMMPPDTVQSLALVDLVAYFGWKRMAILSSDTDYGVNGLVKFQSEAANKGWVILAAQRFRAAYPITDIVAMEELEIIKQTGVRVIILHCLAPMAAEVLKQAKVLGMTEPGWAWIVTDGTTGMHANASLVEGLIGLGPQTGSGRLYQDFVYAWEDVAEHDRMKKNFDAYSALVADAVLTFAYAANAMYADPKNQQADFNTSALDCEQTTETHWEYGRELLQHIHKVRGNGVASYIEFGPHASPLRPVYTIVSSRKDGWIKVGQWNPQERLQITRLVTFMGGSNSVRDYVSTLANKTLRVVTNEYPPFTKLLTDNYTRSNIPLTDITGFTIDMLNEVARLGGFTYTLYLQEHKLWTPRDEITGQWKGVIGDLIEGKADIAPELAITSIRKRDVDFTHPYVYGALKFVMKKPKEPPIRPFQFLDPFTKELWMFVLITTVLVAIAISFLNKLSPYDYHGEFVYAPIGNIENEGFSIWKKFKARQAAAFRKLSLSNSIFHCISFLLSQGADHCPKSVSGRVTIVLWWLAIVVLTSTYTANLTAFVTVSRLQTSINSLEDLAGQTRVSYGTLRHSAYSAFFEHNQITMYQDIFTHMMTRDTNTPSTLGGVDKVRNSTDFAFIADYFTLEHEAHQQPCDLRVVGTAFASAPWSLALPKNSPYKEELSEYIIQLEESGFLEHLMEKWILSGDCKPDNEGGDDSTGDKLHYTNMLGVFYLIGGALVLSFVVIVVEWVVKISTAVDKLDPCMPNTVAESARRHVDMWKKDVYFDWLLRLPPIGGLSRVMWGKQEAAARSGGDAHLESPQECTRQEDKAQIKKAAATGSLSTMEIHSDMPDQSETHLSQQYFRQGPVWFNKYHAALDENTIE